MLSDVKKLSIAVQNAKHNCEITHKAGQSYNTRFEILNFKNYPLIDHYVKEATTPIYTYQYCNEII